MPSPQFPIRPENHARPSALLADTGNNAHCGHGERRRAGLWRVGSGSFHSTGASDRESWAGERIGNQGQSGFIVFLLSKTLSCYYYLLIFLA